jgi:hypothetical protein
MNTTKAIANHLKQVYFGGNWSSSDLKTVLNGISWEQANHKNGSTNSILALVYHLNYYVERVSRVLEEGALLASDNESYNHPEIDNEASWEALKQQVMKDGAHFAEIIERLPDSILEKDFTDKKYGNYYSNLQGIIEHIHYHLGQIVILRKLL